MSKRKEKIKNIAIVFLSIMLVLTFFSNTIMNYSLVEVSTQAIYGGSITTKVRGSGTVTAEEGYSVTIEESRKIATVNVRTGDEVKEGDVLFTLEESDSEELKTVKDALKTAEDAYALAVLEAGITVEERKVIESGNFGSLTERQQELVEVQSRVDALQARYDELEAMINSPSFEAMRDAVAAARTERDAAEAALNEVRAAFDAGTATQADVDNAQAAYDAARKAYDDAQFEPGEIGGAFNNVQQELAAAKKELEGVDGVYALQISLHAQYEDLCELREEVNELEEKATDAQIVSPMAGTVTEISCYAGQTVTPETVMMQIKPESEAYTLQFTVTQNQAKRIKVGDPAEILYNWSGSDVTARVRSIQRDPVNRESSIVTCELQGDVMVGDNYTVSIGEQSSEYDHVVPTSCIREDSNGKFILIIEAKSTPLGNRYYARRVDVEVITSDDSQSAITGALENYVYVITTTTKPVEENQQVRLAAE